LLLSKREKNMSIIYFSLTGISFFLLLAYCSLLIYFRQGFKNLKSCSSKEFHKVSVIIPAHNEEKSLPHLLDCLSKQHYPEELTEFVFIDDRSEDKTGELIKSFLKIHKNASLIRINNTISAISPKKYAISKGIESSTGEIILTTDADTSPGPEWIDGMAKNFTDNIGAVLGYAPYRTTPPYNGFFHRLLALEYFSMGAVAASTAGMDTPSTCNGANFSYRKEIFNKIGGFGKTTKWLSGDDDLFLQRIKEKSNYKIRYSVSDGTAVFTDPPGNLKQFIRQRIRFASKHLAYPARMLAVLSVIFAFYCCLLLLLIGSFFSMTLFQVFLIIMGIKAIFEISFLARAQKLLEKRNLLIYYPFAVIPHIFYVVIFPILGQLVKPRW
jgi:cellulose synthase/poly-beta-1,6-N-acetylglucosamine synthase-like glycosyltransferase